MPELRLCSIPGCGKGGKLRRGWCSTHYTKWWKYGDPLAGGTPGGALMRFILETALPFTGDDCLPWPYSRANYGYGEIVINGRKRLAHRIICELAHGSAPEGKNDAAHSCGNRLCCNPRHLRWASRQENVDDTLIHGTRLRGERVRHAKLTEQQVIEIRGLISDGVRKATIAKQYGITEASVLDIDAGRTWSWL